MHGWRKYIFDMGIHNITSEWSYKNFELYESRIVLGAGTRREPNHKLNIDQCESSRMGLFL
jgi:hypothetical protein